MNVNIALLTVTDTRTFENDKSGAILVKKIEESKHTLIDRKICKDNKEDIVKILKDWTNQKNIDVIITTGGTGLTGRDITPEAINEIADKHIPGFGEIFRTISLKNCWHISNSIKSLCGFIKWEIYICLTRFIGRSYRCLGSNFSSSTGYKS